MAKQNGSKPDFDLDGSETLTVGLGGKTYTISSDDVTPGLDRRIGRWFAKYREAENEEQDEEINAEFYALMARILGISVEEAQGIHHGPGVQVLLFLVKPLATVS